MFSEVGCEPSKAVFVDNEESIRQLIKSGVGVSLLRMDDAEQAEAEGWGVRWVGYSPSIVLSVAIQSRRTQEPILQACVDELSKLWSIDVGDIPNQKVSQNRSNINKRFYHSHYVSSTHLSRLKYKRLLIL
jgi:hypothetical protein